MFFRLIDHYNDEINIKEDNKEIMECFICYEVSYENELKPIKLNSNNIYLKKCKCDGYIHKNCLTLWYEKSKKCPVCRSFMTEKTNVSVIAFTNGGYILFMYLVVKKNINRFLRFFSVIFLFYFISDFYISLIIKNQIYYDYDYNYYSGYSGYSLNKSIAN
jgi:hypothetical protein